MILENFKINNTTLKDLCVKRLNIVVFNTDIINENYIIINNIKNIPDNSAFIVDNFLIIHFQNIIKNLQDIENLNNKYNTLLSETKNTYYLKSDKFNQTVKKAFNTFFDLYGFNGKYYNNYPNKPYVVFDFDDTLSIMDSQDSVFAYMTKNKIFNLNPDEFKKYFTEILDNKILNIKFNETNTVQDLFDDILTLFNKIYYNNSNQDIENEYFTKLLFFMGILMKFGDFNLKTQITLLNFVGFSKKEAREIVKNSLQEYLSNKNFINKLSTENSNSKISKLSFNFKDGFNIPDETKELLYALYHNGFDIYICSASFFDVIKGIVDNPSIFGINYISGIYALRATHDKKYLFEIEDNSFVTRMYGKSELIENILCKKYGYGPIMVSGDSMGDFTMMTEFKDTKLVLFHNKSLDDDTKLIVKAARLQEDNINFSNNDTIFVLQGKDFNKGEYINSSTSILLGNTNYNTDIPVNTHFNSIKELINSSSTTNFKGYKTK